MKKLVSVISLVICLVCLYMYARMGVDYPNQHVKKQDIALDNLKEIKLSNDQVINTETEEVIFEKAITQSDIIILSGVNNIKRLDIIISGEDIDLSPLVSLSQLQELAITFSTGDKVDLDFIKELKCLTSVSIDRCCELEDLSVFEDMPYLQKLFVEYVEDVDLNYLARDPNLRDIHIVGGHIRNAEGISGFPFLKDVYLFDNHRYQQSEEQIFLDMDSFSDMLELEWMLLAHINIKDIEPLIGAPNLRELILIKTGVDDIEPLSNLPNLSCLSIYGNESERVTEQAGIYFDNTQTVIVTEDIPNPFYL
ncbi:MAG: leucine-rich repeat domain-containing protein [Lachnospiraceae bacterium]|nr:leucine-rich repeat domain-containing protein [Lachnospiraceae bacterium]